MKTASASPGARLAPRLLLIICGQELWQILCGVSQGQIVSVLMIE